MQYEKTREVLEALEPEGVVYSIFGAVALNLHGLARATQDLALFIASTEGNVVRLRTALSSVLDDPHIDEITADDLLGDSPAIQYVPPEGAFYIDILTRLGEGQIRGPRDREGRLRRDRGHGRDAADASSDETLDCPASGPADASRLADHSVFGEN